MGELFVVFLFGLFVVAILVGEDFILTLLYLLLGAFIVGKWWGWRALRGLQVERDFNRHAFLGESLPVSLKVRNKSWLPLAWLHVRESLPAEVYSSGPFQQVTTLGPRASMELSYRLECRKRGFYPLGPLDLISGDVFGMSSSPRMRLEPDYLAVFPKIIPLTRVKLPSQAPLGSLRSHQPLFEDPSRTRGKREYVVGDSLRRVDWKASATVGRLQVKLFEPSIALETAIFLNLNAAEYTVFTRFDVPELAIVVAASLANWVINARQSVGLASNGVDPLQGGETMALIPARRGRGHLMRLLESLARVQTAETFPFVDLIRQHSATLPWGTTLIVITNHIDDDLFDALFQARRAGLSVFLIVCGQVSNFAHSCKKAAYFGIPALHILNENDLDIWRQ